ncbi:MAG: hypothetical protein P8J32_03215, partial [bacterium]|nr:hypothetical protein [bacterium]
MEVPNITPTEPVGDSKKTDGHALWIVLVLVLSLICIALAVIIWGMQTTGDLPVQQELVPNENTQQEPDEIGLGMLEEGTDGTIPLIMSIHMESSSSRVCDDTDARCATDEEWEYLLGVTETLVQSLDENNLKGTFQMQSLWMTRLQDSDRGIAIIDSIVDGGHEVAVHRHGFTHNDWDGYSDNEAAHEGHDVYTELEVKP